MSEGPRTHPCPVCSVDVVHWERYPDQVCDGCILRASDAYGRRLIFTNVGISGGFAAFYRESGEPYDSAVCWIDGIKCSAGEHRFGGIIVEAVGSPRG